MPESIFHRHPVKTVLVLLAAWVALLDGLAGAYLIPGEAATIRMAHHYFHHGLRPLKDTRAAWGYTEYVYRTNSLGMRDATPRQVALSNSKKRIVLMGDSFAEGLGANYEETVAGLLGRSLGEEYEVLNAAVVSYSPKLYYLKTRYLLEKVGLRFDRLIVFADLSDVMNEVTSYLRFQPLEDDPEDRLGHRIRAWLRAHSYLGRTADTLLSSESRPDLWDRNFRLEALQTQSPEEAMWNTLNNPIDSWPDIFTEEVDEGMRSCLLYMGKLVALCRQHGISVDLVVYPWPQQIFTRRTDSRYNRMWRDFAREQQITLVDCFPAFLRPDLSSQETYSRFFIPGDVHWNPRGHQLVADTLLKTLRSEPR